MPKVYAIDGIVPVVDSSAFVHPSAVLIGDVIVGARAYIGPCASLRGDFGRIVVEEGANIQDGCIMHGFPGKDTVAGAETTIGHGAVLHGCTVQRGALVGMNCVVNDNAEVGEEAVRARGREHHGRGPDLAQTGRHHDVAHVGRVDRQCEPAHAPLSAARGAQREHHGVRRGADAHPGSSAAYPGARRRAAFRDEEEPIEWAMT